MVNVTSGLTPVLQKCVDMKEENDRLRAEVERLKARCERLSACLRRFTDGYYSSTAQEGEFRNDARAVLDSEEE